jgi:tetratricopeptide (TPR) repeat protein
MFILKVILIILWFVGAFVLFGYLPRPTPSPTKVVKPVVDQPLATIVEKKVPVVQTMPVVEKNIEVKPSPVVKQVEVVEEVVEIEKEEEVDYANVEIFTTPLKLNLNFYQSLSNDDKTLFDRFYVLEGPDHLVKNLNYLVNGDNQSFFKYVFNHLYTYRKLMASSLLAVLTAEVLRLSEGNPKIQTILYEIATRTAYFRRKDVRFLNLAEGYAREDIKLHQSVFKSQNTYVYSYTRLAIILEKKKFFKEALALIDEALRLNLNDKTVNGYKGRKVRVLEKMEKVK